MARLCQCGCGRSLEGAHGNARYASRACKLAAQRPRGYRPDYYAANREAYAKRYRAYYETHRDQIIARGRRYKEANRERYRQADHARYLASPEKWRAWRQRNPAKTRAGDALKRALRSAGLSVEDRHQTREYMHVLRCDPCCYCGGPMEHFDHVVAISRGGTGSWENLTAACGECNLRKYTKPLLRFLAEGWG